MRLLLLLLLLVAVVGAQAQSRSFCDRYTDALFGPNASLYPGNQTSLVRAVVYRSVFGCSPNPPIGAFYPQDTCAAAVAFEGTLSANSPILDVFKGQVPFKPSPTDFTNPINVNQTLALVEKLVAFFGNALGCTSVGFPVFPTFVNQARIHDGMGITQTDFSFFNSRVTASMRSFGVSEKDITYIVNPFLASFGACSAQAICQDVTVCDLATVSADANCKQRSDLQQIRAIDRGFDLESDRKRWTISFVPSLMTVLLVGLMFYAFYGMLVYPKGSVSSAYEKQMTSPGRSTSRKK